MSIWLGFIDYTSIYNFFKTQSTFFINPIPTHQVNIHPLLINALNKYAFHISCPKLNTIANT